MQNISEFLLSTAAVVCYFSTIVVCLALVHRFLKGSFVVSIPTICFSYYALFALIGSLPLFLGVFPYRWALGIREPSLLFQLLAYSSICMILILLSFNRTFSAFGIGVRQYSSKIPLSKKSLIFSLCVISFAVSMTCHYLLSVDRIALFEIFKSSGDSILARSDMTNAYSGLFPYHYYSICFADILPFFCYLFLANAIMKKSVSSWILFSILIVLTIFFNTLDTQKAPAALIMLGCVLTLIHAKNLKISFQFLAIGGGVISVCLWAMYIFFMKTSITSIGDVLFAPFERIMAGQLAAAYYYLDMFPSYQDFLGGRSFPNPRNLIGFEAVRLPYVVKLYMEPYLVGSDVVGTAPAVFWAELYANFDFLGPLIASVFLGIGLYLIHAIVESVPDHPLRSALVVWVGFNLMVAAVSSLGSIVINLRLTLIALFSLMILRLDNFISFRKIGYSFCLFVIEFLGLKKLERFFSKNS